ncbi:hypothetical protein LCGC14_0626600 [marine sediment metagenome]|uniref:Uncharacterized protein n=1 Tax=marine sediment metagenome TaxID=412755 RepID=A0A0F9RMM4_9ZZZZ
MLKLPCGFGFYLSKNKIEQYGDSDIGYGHEINDTIIDALGGSCIAITLKNGPAHGTLRFRNLWNT